MIHLKYIFTKKGQYILFQKQRFSYQSNWLIIGYDLKWIKFKIDDFVEKKRTESFLFAIIPSQISLKMREKELFSLNHRSIRIRVVARARGGLTIIYRNYLPTSLARISLCIISVALRLTMNDCNYLHCNNQRHGYWLGEDNNVLFGHRAIMRDNGGVNINVKTDSGTSKLFARRLRIRSKSNRKGLTRSVLRGSSSFPSVHASWNGRKKVFWPRWNVLNFFVIQNPRSRTYADWYEILTWTYQCIFWQLIAAIFFYCVTLLLFIIYS